MMPPQVDEVPPPPRGPGVFTPFSAPPRDRDLKGLWIGLGVGGLVLVLCCVGGVLGIGFLMPYADSLGKAQVASVVEDYLTALRNEDYATAHDEYLCAHERQAHSVAWFEDHFGSAKVTEFVVNSDDVQFTQEIRVPARVREGGNWVQKEYVMEQDGTQYVICGGVD
jgi:hypothetical protein